MKVKCPNCSHVNTEEQLEHRNRTNEEGEEFCYLVLDCADCNKTIYVGYEWGEWECINHQEVYEEIESHVKQADKIN